MRQKYAEGLARQHHDHQLSQRVLRAWYGLIQDKWRNRVEMLYESKIQDSCRQLSDEYEIKIKLVSLHVDLCTAYVDRQIKSRMNGVMKRKMNEVNRWNEEEIQSKMNVLLLEIDMRISEVNGWDEKEVSKE